MRSMDRNKRYVYYKTLTGKTEDVDDYGNKTGQYTNTYSSVVTKRMNESAAKGTYEIQEFGGNANYSKTLVTNDISCTLDENSIVWLDLGAISTYSTTVSYLVGNLVIYSGTIYKCKTPTSGAWVASNWEAIPYNYIVVGVAKSINSVTYAIRKVQVNG